MIRTNMTAAARETSNRRRGFLRRRKTRNGSTKELFKTIKFKRRQISNTIRQIIYSYKIKLIDAMILKLKRKKTSIKLLTKSKRFITKMIVNRYRHSPHLLISIHRYQFRIPHLQYFH